MNQAEKLDLIRTTGVIAIMRAQSSDQLVAAAQAIQAGGVLRESKNQSGPR